MSIPRPAPPAKLFVSVIGADGERVNTAIALLMDSFGEADYISPWRDFAYTDYYEREMGHGLRRRFASFAEHVSPESLPEIKLKTNDLERRLAVGGSRRVNIDPGYVTAAHLILATGKGYGHRPYLRGGIYADLTLVYRAGAFQTLPWTYPDYAAPETRAMLEAIRRRHLGQLRGSGKDQHD
ncbi:MAG: DUF4416 family protein [Pseudomonadota bacterium]|nr:DUF4416 family protein [Pseudomonadota bacterium]